MNEQLKIFFDLEEKLQSVDTRTSVSDLENLIADDFVEFGTSGNKYNKQDVLNSLPNENGKFKYIMSDFSTKEISHDVVQTQYKTDRIENNINHISSFRSSLWRNEGDQWKMFFHQGTLIKYDKL